MTDPAGRATVRRNVALLAVCQALANTSTGVILAVSALVGYKLAADKSLATMPHAVQWEATAAFAIPVAMIMRRFGRRVGFVFGALLGTAGALVGAFSVFVDAFWIYVLSTVVVGGFTATAQHYRFAAAEVADEAFRSKAISLVVGGALVAAFLGPEVAKLTKDLVPVVLEGSARVSELVAAICGPGAVDLAAGRGAGPRYEYAGTFLALALIPLMLAAVVTMVKFPPHRERRRADSGRHMWQIGRQPGFVVAVLCAVIGWGVMVLMMTATPIAMIQAGYEFDQAAFVVQWHMVGMFAPSFVTGWLIGRIGLINVLLLGLILTTGAAIIGISGMTVSHFWLANVCVGAGWNFLFVGGTTLLTYVYRSEERAKAQGVNDFLVFQSVAVFSFSAGWLLSNLGWAMVCTAILPFIAAVFVAVLWLRLKPGAAPPGVIAPRVAAAE